MTSGAGQPDGTRLRHTRRTARAVECECDGMTARKLPPKLHERPAPAARRRASRGPIPKPRDYSGDPFAVEVRAGDDDNATIPPVQRGGKDPAVPEREYRRPASAHEIVEVVCAFNAPLERAPQPGGEWKDGGGNKASFP